MKGTSDKSKERLGKMMDGFSEFEGIMKDATRVSAPLVALRSLRQRPLFQFRCTAARVASPLPLLLLLLVAVLCCWP